MSIIPQGPPLKLIAGDSTTFTILDSLHSSDEWALSFSLFNPELDPVAFTGEIQAGGGFIVTLTAPQTKDVLPAEYFTACVFSKTGSRETVPGPSLWVIPDMTKTLAKSQNQLQLEALQGVQLKLSSGANSAVGMNGQTFTKKNLADVKNQIVYLQARIIREKEQLRALLDLPGAGKVVSTFDSMGGNALYPGIYTR